MTTCPVCKSQNEDSQNSCKSCGFRLYIPKMGENIIGLEREEVANYTKELQEAKTAFNAQQKQREEDRKNLINIYETKITDLATKYEALKEELERYKRESQNPKERFTKDDDRKIIIDNKTGLMWENQLYTRKKYFFKDFKYTWQEATDYAKNLRLGGYSDWRLASLDELHTIMTASYERYDSGWSAWYTENQDKKNTNSRGDSFFIHKAFVENIKSTYFWAWSSTKKNENGYNSSRAWSVGFGNGDDYWNYVSYESYALCVRG